MGVKLPTPYYKDEQATIYCADCREILPLLEPGSVDLVLTDPPYNAGKVYHNYSDDLPIEDYQNMMKSVICECRLIASNQAWVAPRYQLDFFLPLFPKAHLVVIRRGAAGPNRGGWLDQFETLITVGKPSRCIPDLWDDIRLKGEGFFFREATYGHPGYTPQPIMARAISLLSPEGGTILDPFGGTGTSAVAAKRLGRKAILIEQSEHYAAIAVERLRQGVLL